MAAPKTTANVTIAPVAGAAKYDWFIEGKKVTSSVPPTVHGLQLVTGKANNISVSPVMAPPPVIPPPVTPPPVTGPSPTPPQGPFKTFTTAQEFRDTGNPTTISGLSITTTDAGAFLLDGWFPNPAVSPSAFTVQDIIGICNAPFDDSGRVGFGIRLGTWVNAQRIHGEGPDEGIWLGTNVHDSIITDFYGKGSVGAYLEHVTQKTTLRNGELYGDTRSVQVEWTYGGVGSHEITFDTIKVYCGTDGGIVLGPGTWGCVGKNLNFYGPGPAWVQPANLAGPTQNVLDEASCTFANAGPRVVIDSDPIG